MQEEKNLFVIVQIIKNTDTVKGWCQDSSAKKQVFQQKPYKVP